MRATFLLPIFPLISGMPNSHTSIRGSPKSTSYIPNVLHITKGSSAGTPLAGLIYSMAMSRAICKFRETAGARDIESHVNIDGNIHEIVHVSFVDDVAIPVCDNAIVIVQKTRKVVRCACDVFDMHGMALNPNKGKSEGIIDFRGGGFASC